MFNSGEADVFNETAYFVVVKPMFLVREGILCCCEAYGFTERVYFVRLKPMF